MRVLQLLKSEFENHPWVDSWRNRLGDIQLLDDYKDVNPNMPALMGADIGKPHCRYFLENAIPSFYIGRGYVGNHLHKKRKFWRASMNSWNNILLRRIPHSRWNVMGLPKHKWKVKEVKRVLIAPSKFTTNVWVNSKVDAWAESYLDKFPGAEVKIRYKKFTPVERFADLWQDLDWADLVLTQSSAITCEAFWYGKKVISFQPCPTWAAGCDRDLSDWRNPKEPQLRDLWHEHLAWSQFTVDEWTAGDPFYLLQDYLGDIMQYKDGYTYSFGDWL